MRDTQPGDLSGQPCTPQLAPEVELGVQIIVSLEVVRHLTPDAMLAFKRRVLAYAEAEALVGLSIAGDSTSANSVAALCCNYCKNSPAAIRGLDVLCADCEYFLGAAD